MKKESKRHKLNFIQRNILFSALFVFLNFILIACLTAPQRSIPQSANTNSTEETQKSPKITMRDMVLKNTWVNNNKTFLYLMDENPIPGSINTIVFLPVIKNGKTIPQDTVYTASLFNSSGKRLTKSDFFQWSLDGDSGANFLLTSVFSVPSTAAAGIATLRIEGDRGFYEEIPLLIAYKKFISEEIPLSPSNTSLRTEPDPQKTKESQRLWSILATTGTSIYTDGPFSTPVARDTRRTSFFGDRRVYKYSNGKSDTAIHAGIDYGVPTGTQVLSPAAGRVVLACPRIVTGNSVILEHLPGVYTIYYHLDKIFVNENDIVEEGVVLGLSGSTGLATGPHLHWEIRAATENTDPDIVSSRPILDKEQTIQKIILHYNENNLLSDRLPNLQIEEQHTQS
ncbi:MAG: M23 family metallopeptidase [Spirochaetaceae bacterium]|nr:M23 family metallopeptidase [Spirochaetaceae bacterium]